MTVDPNLLLLEEAAAKLKPFLDEIVFVGGVTLGLLITDNAGASIRGTNDVDIVAEILTYPDYIAFSEHLALEASRRILPLLVGGDTRASSWMYCPWMRRRWAIAIDGIQVL